MAEKDGFAEKRRAHEEEYFRKQERELIEKMRERARVEADREGLAEATGVTDEEVLANLQDLGFTPETIQLLHLVPLIYVAWADGGVTERERSLIKQLAESHGVEPGSTADNQLNSWLELRPSETFLTESLRLIRALISAQGDGGSASATKDLVYCCSEVARVSGGILGFGNKISAAEQSLIDRIAREIEQDHSEAAKTLTDSEP